mmetsp:Transcript_2613/g.9640  ORF Transcript_2613/g.9640 Transcript_2613/m.9640 type:complete len:248 (+) Transcript_2613:508-1251(+)
MPFSLITDSHSCRITRSWLASSALEPTRGTMMSGKTSHPSLWALHAASRTALAWVLAISGWAMASRQPLNPSMGLTSCSFSTRCKTSWRGTLVSSEMAPTRSSSSLPSGKNSCRGGSSSLMVTGRPRIARKMPSKSSLWNTRISSRAFRLSASSAAMIILLTLLSLSSVLKNMCSVLTSPMPSAPFSRAFSASSGVSAFASTRSFLISSTQPMNSSISAVIFAAWTASLPSYTLPSEPSRETQSPLR